MCKSFIPRLFQGGFAGFSKWFRRHVQAVSAHLADNAGSTETAVERTNAPNPLAQVLTGKLYEVQKYCALSNHCWSGYWIVGNRRALAGLPAD
jgi:hypothetical protein